VGVWGGGGGVGWGGGGGVRQPRLRADNLAIFMCRLSRNSGILNLLKPYSSSQVSDGITK
jgi:hypothetical protein